MTTGIQHVVGIDPGKMNGVAAATVTGDGHLTWSHTYQFAGGAVGLREFIEVAPTAFLWHTKVAEKFVPFGVKGSNFTLDMLEPLRGEGILIAKDWLPDYTPTEKSWQVASKQYMYGGKTKVEKRKLGKEFLKKHGWYLTGKDVGQKDAEDAISARFHVIYYLTHTVRHKAFWDRYFSKEA